MANLESATTGSLAEHDIILSVSEEAINRHRLGEDVVKNSKTDIDSIKNKIIMPAGNVFSYAGVDIDSQGNFFVHISFALGAEGVDQQRIRKTRPG